MVDLSDDIGRLIALSESAGVDNDLKLRLVKCGSSRAELSRSEGDRQAGRVLSGLALRLIRQSVLVGAIA